ncbi:UDP-4-amino-4,6-dideoxy-N-acetyl-beta-L-altrosamine transaminase [Prochlorococcus sp. MIT 1223]|uniref:UDP-4-amino-4, 6-dideoxy-N-acetyl-beta-L-altrosamine transaminase n=1 Tax=Prochlorococcus sp. MIT 1223 TaxID=3096217 RepID=UPI002A75799C|nr:UDP-4-amino-4,6-dideoxy-N-acetyl-beta-L-altrosamine transaminase [Prochlorococcus sp. MIT 1223]
MIKQKVLIIGSSGLLGKLWYESLSYKYDFKLAYNKRKTPNAPEKNLTRLNIECIDEITNYLNINEIDIVVNLASLTNIEICQQNFELAYKINRDYARNIALSCKQSSSKLIHISTDHLFGNENRLYTEEDRPLLLNNYAKSKYAGECETLSTYPNALICRTNFFGFGPVYRNSFSDWIINSLRNQTKITLFNDVYFTPVLGSLLAKYAHELIEKEAYGIYNISSDDTITKYQFGEYISDIFGLNKELLEKGSLSQRSDLTKRPLGMALSNQKAKSKLKKSLGKIKEQISLLSRENNDIYNYKYGQQCISEDDIQAVVNALRGENVTQGPLLVEFENKIAKKVKANYATATNSATSALHLACLALGLKKGQRLWTSSISFLSSANCGIFCGAKIDFVDIETSTALIDTLLLEEKLEKAEKIGKLPHIVVPVHLAGTSCDMKKIRELSHKYGFKVIEDASHAIGGSYLEEPIGCCKYSDISVFSFHPVKIITTLEGGMALTNDQRLNKKMEKLRGHGIVRDQKEFILKSPGPWYYEQQELGFNYRFNEIQASLGISQLNKLEEFVNKRHSLMRRYRDWASKYKNIAFLSQPKDCYSSYHLAIIRLKNSTQQQHLSMFEFMRKQGVFVQLHYWPIHLHPYYLNLGFKKGDYPNAELYGTTAFSLPLYPSLDFIDQDKIIKILEKGLEENKLN